MPGVYAESLDAKNELLNIEQIGFAPGDVEESRECFASFAKDQSPCCKDFGRHCREGKRAFIAPHGLDVPCQMPGRAMSVNVRIH